MNLRDIINDEMKEYFETARNIGRKTLDKYFSNIPYTKDEKKKEINFFYKDIEFITKKWILEIIWELETYKGSNFNELKRQIRGISSRTLSDRLKELQNNGIIDRIVQKTHPPSVLYELSEKGKGFVEMMTLVILYLKQEL